MYGSGFGGVFFLTNPSLCSQSLSSFLHFLLDYLITNLKCVQICTRIFYGFYCTDCGFNIDTINYLCLFNK